MLAVGLAKIFEKMYAISHKEMAVSAILDFGRLIQNPKRATKCIDQVCPYTKYQVDSSINVGCRRDQKF